MTYEQLLDFVQNRMKVSLLYLPVVHLGLLRGGCSIKETDRSIIVQVE
jgi:hypothetical protein